MYRRDGKIVARITAEEAAGRKDVAWAPLEAQTPAEAKEALNTLLVQRAESRLRHIGQCSRLGDYTT